MTKALRLAPDLALPLESLGDAAGLNSASGTFSTYLSRLRTLELIESGPRMAARKRGVVLMTDAERLRAMAERDELLAGLQALIDDWRERARRVRPLESGPITAEKRARTAEWMFYTNRAIELQAVIEKASAEH